MLRLFRLSFEVVREGRILKKIKNLQRQFIGVFYLVPGWCQVLEKLVVFD